MNLSQAVTGARVGHVHLKVSNLERAVAFYRDILGMQVMAGYGKQAAFLSYDGYHHHLGLNTWESEGCAPPPRHSTGLYHVALLYPSRAALGRVVRQVIQAGISLEGASDHGVSEAVYLSDPDGNGLELYRDRPEAEWPRDGDGNIAMITRRLDLQELLDAVPRL